MGCNATETDWPSVVVVSDEKKSLLEYYFSLLDTNEANVGDNIAELFTDHGCMISPAGNIRGSEGMFRFIITIPP